MQLLPVWLVYSVMHELSSMIRVRWSSFAAHSTLVKLSDRIGNHHSIVSRRSITGHYSILSFGTGRCISFVGNSDRSFGTGRCINCCHIKCCRKYFVGTIQRLVLDKLVKLIRLAERQLFWQVVPNHLHYQRRILAYFVWLS